MEKFKIGDKIIITAIEEANGKRYWSSGSGQDPQDITLPYETTVKSINNGTYNTFGDGTYGFWTEKTSWVFTNLSYEIY